jgi:hypothetical protein
MRTASITNQIAALSNTGFLKPCRRKALGNFPVISSVGGKKRILDSAKPLNPIFSE